MLTQLIIHTHVIFLKEDPIIVSNVSLKTTTYAGYSNFVLGGGFCH